MKKEHEKMREEVSLVAVSGQLLLECEAECTALEAKLEQEREKHALAEKAFAEFYLMHQKEMEEPEEKEDASPGILAKLDELSAAMVKGQTEAKIDRASIGELSRRIDMIAEMLKTPESSEVGEIRIDFERGADGKIKSPLRIN